MEPKITKSWPTKKLGEVCDILDNLRKPITRRDRESGPYPYYGATGIQDHVAGYIFDEDLILVGEDGARWDAGENSAYKISGKSWVNNHAHVLRPHRDILLDDWLVHYLNISDLSEYITGTTVKKLNQAKLRSIEIPLPPLAEQKKIVAKLEKLLVKVNDAKKLRAEAQEAASQLLPAELHKIFEEGKKKGWEGKKLGDVITFINGKAHEQYIKPTGKFKVINSKFIASEGLVFKMTDNSLSPLFKNDVVMVMSDVPNGKALAKCYFIESNSIYTLNQRIGCFRVKNVKDLDPRFLFIQLNRNWQLLAYDQGRGQTNLRKNDILSIKILIPPLTEQKKIVARLDSISEKTRQLQDYQKSTARDLLTLEQSILHKAFSGGLVN